jgi:hypothetical protein
MKESYMEFQKKKVAVKHGSLESDLSSNPQRPKPSIAIVARQQTIDEQHRFNAAIDALLVELVRRQMGRRS